MSPIHLKALTDRIRAEFVEMPGLHLTVQQAARLWGLEQPVCRQIVDILVASAFLRWTAAGAIVRADG